MNRFEESLSNTREIEKVREKDKVRPPSGPVSSNPGQWLTEIYENCSEEDKGSEAYQSALAIIESYRPGPRMRSIKHPISNAEGSPGVMNVAKTFITEVPTLEARSLSCFVEDSSPTGFESRTGFSMLGATAVLKELKVPEWPTDRALGSADYALPSDKIHEKTGDRQSPHGTESKCVSQKILDAYYATWLANPSTVHSSALWDALYAYISRKASFEGRSKSLRLQGLSQDAVNDFLTSLHQTLQKNNSDHVRIDKFSNYVNRAWKNRLTSASMALKEQNRVFPASSVERPSVDGGESENPVSVEDQRAHLQAQVDMREPTDPPLEGEALLEARRAKLAFLAPDAADYVGCKLVGQTDKLIAQLSNLSRQSVGRRKIKAVKQLREAALGDAA